MERVVGVMGAMPQEVDRLYDRLTDRGPVVEKGMRHFESGRLGGHSVVVVTSRLGKVAAAVTAAELILQFQVDSLVFTGVAGAIDTSLEIGDVVVGNALYHHDMDARPLFERHTVPLLDRDAFETDVEIREGLLAAARGFLAQRRLELASCGDSSDDLSEPRAIVSDIASGERFVRDRADREDIRSRLPTVSAIDMESAAVAQIAYEYGVGFGVVRTISDSADGDAPEDFTRFVEDHASLYSAGIVERYLRDIA